jgi:hypothetical protein
MDHGGQFREAAVLVEAVTPIQADGLIVNVITNARGTAALAPIDLL